MMASPNNIDPEKWSERLGLPYYKQEWFNYVLGHNHRDRHYGFKKSNSKMGGIANAETKYLSQTLNLMLDSIIDGRWENVSSLYGGLIAFCLKYCKEKITYYEDNRKKDQVSVAKCCNELKFPTWCRSRLEKIFNMKLSFEDYLHAFDDSPVVNFDVDGAMMVYKLQGEKAIFSILMQLFFKYKYMDKTTANLVSELPIIWTPKVTNLVSGVGFPVVATKFSNKFEWRKNDNGFFLFDEFGVPIDCASVGSFSVFKECLGNRLSFLWESGGIPKYVICWCWGDVVKAVGHFGGDVLVRSLGGGFEKWFRFGLGGELAVWTENGYVYGRKSNKNVPKLRVESYPNEGRWASIVNLGGVRVDDIIGEEVVWTWEELCDWFELGRMCKKELEN